MGSAKNDKEVADVQARHVFAYCHDSVGIGHLNRTLAICQRVRWWKNTSVIFMPGHRSNV